VSSAASRFTAEWLNLGPPATTATISLEDLNKFRVGAYCAADDDTKEKWCTVMLHFLPCVCSKYGKSDVRVALRASEASTPADEALLMWYIRHHAKEWEAQNAIDTDDLTEDDVDDATTATGKRKRTPGQHMTQEMLEVYLNMLTDTEKKREMSEGGEDWDDALKVAAQQEHNNSKGAKAINVLDDALVGTGTAVVQPRRVIVPFRTE